MDIDALREIGCFHMPGQFSLVHDDTILFKTINDRCLHGKGNEVGLDPVGGVVCGRSGQVGAIGKSLDSGGSHYCTSTSVCTHARTCSQQLSGEEVVKSDIISE